MLKPTVKAEEFEKYGFRKCRGEYGKHGCYYLCVARGVKRIEMQKSLVAQLRQLTEPCTGEGEHDPKSEPKPKQKEEPNSIMAMLNGFFDAEK